MNAIQLCLKAEITFEVVHLDLLQTQVPSTKTETNGLRRSGPHVVVPLGICKPPYFLISFVSGPLTSPERTWGLYHSSGCFLRKYGLLFIKTVPRRYFIRERRKVGGVTVT